jgi:hypothetical protein
MSGAGSYPKYPAYPSFVKQMAFMSDFGMKVKVPFEKMIAPPRDEAKHILLGGGTGSGKTTLMFRIMEGMVSEGWTVVNFPDMKLELMLEAMVKYPDIKVVVHKPSYLEVKYPPESALQPLIDRSTKDRLIANPDSLSPKLNFIEKEHGPNVGEIIDHLEPKAFNILLEPCVIMSEYSRDKRTWAKEAELMIPNLIRSMLDARSKLKPLCIAIDEAEFFLPGARNLKFPNQSMMVNETMDWFKKSRGYQITTLLSSQSFSPSVLTLGLPSLARYVAIFKMKRRGDLGPFGKEGREESMTWLNTGMLWHNVSSSSFIKEGMFHLQDTDIGRFDSRRIVANPERIPYLQAVEPQFAENPEKIITPMPLAPRYECPHVFVFKSFGWVGKEQEIKEMKSQVGLKEILFLQEEKGLPMRRVAEILDLPNAMRVKRSLERAHLMDLRLSSSDKEALEGRFKDLIIPPREHAFMGEDFT